MLLEHYLVDAILALLAAEAVGLTLWCRRPGRGPPVLHLLPNLVAGACLLLALRTCVTEAPASLFLLLCLSGALIAHLVDLRTRWPH